ncbi:AAA family ATPase [Candidatus Nomurabacteria bacterium]|nr:AAA family ATPase [Candidatus Nomurabacteria bacterium]
MTQDEALSILKTGANVFLTGEPGSGKTFTINKFVSYLRERDIEPAITASTGIAATHIGGMTIHSWSGIGIKENLTDYDLDRIASNEYIHKRILKTRVLIIDEVSMLRTGAFAMIDAVCREIKQNPEPFGGMQIVLVGDFFQLPPVEKYGVNAGEQNKLINEVKTYFAFESDAWRRLAPVTCYLTEQHRQDDAEYLSVLSAIRKGEVEELHMERINSRQTSSDKFGEDIECITKLFSRNINVDDVNGGMLNKIEADLKEYEMTSTGKESLVFALKKGCLSPEVLRLKKGAVVMCTKNNPKERFVNGTLGTVEGFDSFTNHPIIKTKSGKMITVEPMDWSVEENGKIKAKITQVPLRLAWAITVHKSQGMSMDAAVMDLSDVFEYGQGYVALSRVRRLSGLYLLGINARALQVHPRILEKDTDFRAGSEKAREVFSNIASEEHEKMQKNFVIAMGGKWRDEKSSNIQKSIGRLEKIREKHANAYRKWTAEEEGEIIAMWKSGRSVKNISALTGRQTGGIRSRLVKLGLIEK